MTITKTGSLRSSIITHYVKKDITKNMTEDEIRRKLKVGSHFPVNFFLSHKIGKSAEKFGKLIPQLVEYSGSENEAIKNIATLIGVPAAEVFGAYYKGNKMLKKEAADGLGPALSVPTMLRKSVVNPINAGFSAYDVASGNKSLGESIGSTVGGAVGGIAADKVLTPLVNLLPPGPIKVAGGVAAFLGSMLAGNYLADKGSNLMKSTPIFKRKNYDDIQRYNNGEI